MKKNSYIYVAFLALFGSLFLQSCSKSLNTAPIAAGVPAISNPLNLLSAYATIGATGAGVTFETPAGIRYSNGHLWVANVSTFVQEWPMTGGAPVTTIWTYNSGVSFSWLFGEGVDPATGNIYVCDVGSNQIAVFNPTGNYLAVFGSAQMSPNPSNLYGSGPTGVAVNSAGTTVYALGQYTNNVYVYSIGGSASNPTYTYQSSFGNTGSGPATLNLVSNSGFEDSNLTVDGGGNVWVTDASNHRLAEYSGTGSYLKSFKISGIDTSFTPVDALVDGSGNVYGVDQLASVVVKFNSSGTVLGQFGQGTLSAPLGITTDGSGNFFVTNNNPQQIVAFH